MSASPSWVIEIVSAILCGLVLFLLLLPCLESDAALPPPKKHGNVSKHPVKPRWGYRKKRKSLKVRRGCQQELEEAWGLISHLKNLVGRLLDKCDFCQHSCEDPPGEVCKAAPAGAHQPCHVPVEETAPARTVSASPDPLAKCPTPLASPLSPDLTASSVSVFSLSPLSASQPPESFLPLGGLSPQPLALSPSTSCPPDSEAHPPPPTASPPPPAPEPSLILPHCDSLAPPLGTILQSSSSHTLWSASPKPATSDRVPPNSPVSVLSWCQVATQAVCSPNLSQCESQEEHLPHCPPEVSFLGDPTDRQVEAGSTSLVNPDVQKTPDILTAKKAELGMWREKEKKEGSDCHLNSEQDPDKGACNTCSPGSITPGDFINPDLWEQLEQHLQKRLVLQQQEHGGGLPRRIQLSLQLRLPDSQFPGVDQAQEGQGHLQLSAFTGESSPDAEKMSASCPAKIPPGMGLDKDVGHSEERTLKHLCSGSAGLPGKILGVSCEGSRRDWARPSTRGPDKNAPRVHVDRKVGQMSAGQVPVGGHRPRCATNLPGGPDVHSEAKDPAPPEDPDPCTNTFSEFPSLSSLTQQVLEAHIRKLQARHRWRLPLRILRPIRAFKLTEAQRATVLQSVSTCSAVCVTKVHLNASFAKNRFLEKPGHSLPREEAIAEELVSTLAGPHPVPSLACEGIQRAQGRTPTGNCRGPSVAPLTRQEGRLPSPFLTYTSEGRTRHSETAMATKEGSWETSPCLARARNEPTEESTGWTSENFLQDKTISELTSDSQSSVAQEARKAKETPAWEVALEPCVPANSRATDVSLRRSGSPRPSKRSPPPMKLVAAVPEEPRPDAQLSEFELPDFVESENQLRGRATGVVLEDCEMGTILQDGAIDVLPEDRNSDVLLVADILPSHKSLTGSQRVSSGDMSTSQVLHEVTSGGSCQQEPLRLQDQYKSQSEAVVPTDEEEDDGKPGPGAHGAGLAEPRASQAREMCAARDEESGEPLGGKSCQHEQKGQVPPESLFKKSSRHFLQWVLPRKGKAPKGPPEKGPPALATAQSWDPGKSRSLTDDRAAEAQALTTAVRQSLEEKLTLHHGLRASQPHWCRGELQTPVGPRLCRQRILYYEEQRRKMKDMADGRHAAPNGHSSSNKSGWTTNRDSKGALPPRDWPGRPWQHAPMVARPSDSSRHCPRHCPLRKYVSSGQPACVAHAFRARTFLQEKRSTVWRETFCAGMSASSSMC